MVASTFCQDVVHCLVVSNYCIECQLLISYVVSISEQVVEKSLAIDVAMKVGGISHTTTQITESLIKLGSIITGTGRVRDISAVLEWRRIAGHRFVSSAVVVPNTGRHLYSHPARISLQYARCSIVCCRHAARTMVCHLPAATHLGNFSCCCCCCNAYNFHHSIDYRRRTWRRPVGASDRWATRLASDRSVSRTRPLNSWTLSCCSPRRLEDLPNCVSYPSRPLYWALSPPCLHSSSWSMLIYIDYCCHCLKVASHLLQFSLV